MNTRLNKSMRESIADSVVKGSKYPKLIAETRVAMSKILRSEAEKDLFGTDDQESINDVITEAKRIQELSQQLNSKYPGVISTTYMRTTNLLYVHIDGFNYGRVCVVEFDGNGESVKPMSFYGSYSVKLNSHTNEQATKYLELKNTLDDLTDKLVDLRQITLATLSGIRTVKQLNEVWPNGVKHLPKDVSTGKNVAVPITKLLKVIADSKP